MRSVPSLSARFTKRTRCSGSLEERKESIRRKDIEGGVVTARAWKRSHSVQFTEDCSMTAGHETHISRLNSPGAPPGVRKRITAIRLGSFRETPLIRKDGSTSSSFAKSRFLKMAIHLLVPVDRRDIATKQKEKNASIGTPLIQRGNHAYRPAEPVWDTSIPPPYFDLRTFLCTQSRFST